MDDDSFNYGMADSDRESNDFEDSQDSDLQQTQSTQQASQQPLEQNNAHLWGYLEPRSAGLTRIDFWKIHPRYTIGRNTEMNQVVFPGFKISNQHCVITWDGVEGPNSSVVVQDNSSNGTFIDSLKIGKGCSRILHHGNEIAFGSAHVPTAQTNGVEDYRFYYRSIVHQSTEGLFGQYDVGAELGKGTFAVVKKAVNKRTGIWYAVKVIHASKAVGQQEQRESNFIREISIMEKLDHRNVCKLVEVFFQEDNSICLVLELVQGGDLLEYILRTQGLTEINARDITYQMCNALAYIHSRGVTHRDLKPENVLLTSDRPPIVKVADFGLAKVVDSATMLRTMCGTPSYLAPEVVSQVDEEGYDNRVDSWSAGVIVFAMMANSSPFLEDETKSVKDRIASRRITWQPLKDKNVSDQASSFIFYLLQVDPKDRMSIAATLDHPWLKAHIPFHPPDFDEFRRNYGTDDSRMNVSHVGVGEPLGDGAHHGGSPSSALRRRSDIIADAEQGRIVLPEPPSEMEINLNRQNPSTPTGKGQNKRMRAELSIVPEDSLEQVYAEAAARNAAGPSTPIVDDSVDSGSNSFDSSSENGPRRSGRRKVARRS